METIVVVLVYVQVILSLSYSYMNFMHPFLVSN